MCRARVGISKRKQLYSKLKSIFCKQVLHERGFKTARVVKKKSVSSKESHNVDTWMDEPQFNPMDEYESDMDILPTEDEEEDYESDDEPTKKLDAQACFNVLYNSYKRIMLKRRAAQGLSVEGYEFPPPPIISSSPVTIFPPRVSHGHMDLSDLLVIRGRVFNEHGNTLLYNFHKTRIDNISRIQSIKAQEKVESMIEDKRKENLPIDYVLEQIRDTLLVKVVITIMIHKSVNVPEVGDALNNMLAYSKVVKKKNFD